VPALAIGVWTAPGEPYNVSTTPIVSGTVIVEHPVSGCSHVTYQLSGVLNALPTVNYIQGTAAINIVTNNPNPSATCGSWTPVIPVSADG